MPQCRFLHTHSFSKLPTAAPGAFQKKIPLSANPRLNRRNNIDSRELSLLLLSGRIFIPRKVRDSYHFNHTLPSHFEGVLLPPGSKGTPKVQNRIASDDCRGKSQPVSIRAALAEAQPESAPVKVGDGPVHVTSATADQMYLNITPAQEAALLRYTEEIE